jgi:hypothetical protein
MSSGIFTSFGYLRLRVVEVDCGPLRIIRQHTNTSKVYEYFVRVTLLSGSSVALTTFSSRCFDCATAPTVTVDEEFMFFNASSAQTLVISLISADDNARSADFNSTAYQKTLIPVERIAGDVEVIIRTLRSSTICQVLECTLFELTELSLSSFPAVTIIRSANGINCT